MEKKWFPIEGNIILRGNKPIASCPSSGDAYAIIRALMIKEKDIDFTVISCDGHYTARSSCKDGEQKEEYDNIVSGSSTGMESVEE